MLFQTWGYNGYEDTDSRLLVVTLCGLAGGYQSLEGTLISRYDLTNQKSSVDSHYADWIVPVYYSILFVSSGM
jgi:hypothetical protein